MDPGDVTSGQNTALVILAFLQTDCSNPEYRKELLSLGNELNLIRDINCNDHRIDALETDGYLETDGHSPSCVSVSLHNIEPSVELQRPRNREAAPGAQQVAEELRQIADQFEHEVVARATRNLRHNISASPSCLWKSHLLLTLEVEEVMRQSVGLEHLPQERVFMALTLTLVKGVCEQAPRFLRDLFSAALHYISPASAR